MFGVLWAGLLLCLFWGLAPLVDGGRMRLEPMLGALPFLAGIGYVVLQWFSHPHGVKDWVQGGVVDIGEAHADRVTWMDWAIAITRRGSLDRRTGMLKLERRLLFGLIPIGTVSRPSGEFYRVEVKVQERTVQNRRRGFFVDSHEEYVVGYTYSVYLVDRRGDRLCVCDLGTGLSGPGERFIGVLREKLEDIIGRPGEAGRGAAIRLDGPRREEPPPPAGDDFDAWRAKQRGKNPPAGR